MALAKAAAPNVVGAYLAAGFAILIWSGTPAATRLAVLDMDPLGAALLRTVLAAAVAIPFLLMQPKRPRPVGRRAWGVLSLTAVTGFFGFTVLFSIGTQMTSATHAALINASIPLFVGVIGIMTERSTPRIAPLQFFMPVVSLALAVAIFQEALTVPLLASATAIVLGIIISKKG